MSLAKAAQRAIKLGGVYDGHELPPEINRMTKASATALAGQGLLAVAKDKYPRDGLTNSTWRVSPKWKWIWKRASTASWITSAWATWAR